VKCQRVAVKEREVEASGERDYRRESMEFDVIETEVKSVRYDASCYGGTVRRRNTVHKTTTVRYTL
jgi:hypothetical protein